MLGVRHAWWVGWLALVAAQAAAPSPAEAINISGRIVYYANDQPLPGVTVRLRGGADLTTLSDGDGYYAFLGVPVGDWTLEPHLAGDYPAGVDQPDAAYLLRSLVSMRTLSSERVLACDTTGNGGVSPLDAARILQLRSAETQLPAAMLCGAGWAFVPNPSPAQNQEIIQPAINGQDCRRGGIAFGPLLQSLTGQNFRAVLFGDCGGDLSLPTPRPSPSPTATSSSTWTPSLTPTRTPTTTPTSTPSPTASFTASFTPTRTPTLTPSHTPTHSPTLTPTATSTLTPTRSATATPTPTDTNSPAATATPTCGSGFSWNLDDPLTLRTHSGGNVWLTRTVPTGTGWGVFWLREDPGASQWARLYYAHVGTDGRVTVEPRLLAVDIPKIAFRGRYYLAAWHQDHYGVLIADRSRLYYYDLSLDGALSGRKTVGPTLFTSTVYDQESDGDLDAYPAGFLGVIEGDCGGHSCAYAFRLDPHGNPTSSTFNLVDYDFTHQFYPRSAYDGAGFALLSVKDISISNGGVVTKYMIQDRSPASRAKVVPAKQYLWDEFPDVAWNGEHYAAVWTENSARSHSAPWQMHFASFERAQYSSTLIRDGLLDVWEEKPSQRWTTQIHALGQHWVAQYVRWQPSGEPQAVYDYLSSRVETLAQASPFPVNDDALGSSIHPTTGTLGIARSYAADGVHTVTFQTLPAPVCTD